MTPTDQAVRAAGELEVVKSIVRAPFLGVDLESVLDPARTIENGPEKDDLIERLARTLADVRDAVGVHA